MRVIMLIIVILLSGLLGFLYLYIMSFMNYLGGGKILIGNKEEFQKIAEKIKGKNYLQRNNKIYIVSNYIITPDTKISGVVEINGEKKSFNNLTLNKLSQYSGIGKIYITKIGDVVLKGTIVLDNYKGGTLIHGDTEEKEGTTNKKK